MDRRASQQSNGLGTAPARVRHCRIPSSSSAEFVAAYPISMSECPARALVPDATTTSAPSSSGRWLSGVAVVLSTATSAPAACAACATSAMSTSSSPGFAGVSSSTSRTPSNGGYGPAVGASTVVTPSWASVDAANSRTL